MSSREADNIPLLSEEGVTSRKCKASTRTILIVLIIVLIIIFGAVGIVLAVFLSSAEPDTDYGVIIDAGSSGSRVYVYSWPHRKNKTTVPHVHPVTPDDKDKAYRPVQITQLRVSDSRLSNVVNPGIAHIKPSQIKGYLQPLLDYANAVVPWRARKRTPIFLFATAGMRVISKADQEAILKEVRSTFSGSDFNFTYQTEWARVISGSEEGVYGWVTTNYLKNILFDDDAEYHVVGALDLGGVSVQITFYPSSPPEANGMELVLPNNVFDLYTYSFLDYGQDAMTTELMKLSCSKANTTNGTIPDEVDFPCFLSGYNETFFLDADGNNHTMVGTGNFDLCSQYQVEIMNVDAECKYSSCSFNGVYQPPLEGDFYAMSGFYYTASFFGLANENRKTNAFAFKKLGGEYCSTSWEDVHVKYPTVSDSHLRIYCLTSSYIYSLLVEGFHFSENNTNIYFTAEINKTTLNWALGGLIAEASLLPK